MNIGRLWLCSALLLLPACVQEVTTETEGELLAQPFSDGGCACDPYTGECPSVCGGGDAGPVGPAPDAGFDDPYDPGTPAPPDAGAEAAVDAGCETP